jgi:hypothetical protein
MALPYSILPARRIALNTAHRINPIMMASRAARQVPSAQTRSRRLLIFPAAPYLILRSRSSPLIYPPTLVDTRMRLQMSAAAE